MGNMLNKYNTYLWFRERECRFISSPSSQCLIMALLNPKQKNAKHVIIYFSRAPQTLFICANYAASMVSRTQLIRVKISTPTALNY